MVQGRKSWRMCRSAVNLEAQIVNNKIRIMVIDDQAVVRQGFVALINTVADMEVIAEGINGQQAIDLYKQHTRRNTH